MRTLLWPCGFISTESYFYFYFWLFIAIAELFILAEELRPHQLTSTLTLTPNKGELSSAATIIWWWFAPPENRIPFPATSHQLRPLFCQPQRDLGWSASGYHLSTLSSRLFRTVTVPYSSPPPWSSSWQNQNSASWSGSKRRRSQTPSPTTSKSQMALHSPGPSHRTNTEPRLCQNEQGSW